MTLICHLLAEDADLADAIVADRRDAAIAECIAPLARLQTGPWHPESGDQIHDGIGVLVMAGLLLRRVGIDGRYGAELLGQGDLLRPWQGEDVEPSIPRTTGWRVLQPARLALLDLRVAQRLARYPVLTGLLAGRALQRSRNLAVNMAIVHQPRVDVRLHALLWHLADRWGKVTPDGVFVPLALSHVVLAELVAARRPTVTSSLAELAERNLVRRVDSGWLLPGEPPAELLELGESVGRRSGRRSASSPHRQTAQMRRSRSR
jgi:CRP-like cAMP-binding protein